MEETKNSGYHPPALKILDKYIIRKFLGTYVFSLGLILAITIMCDINEKLYAFQKAPLRETIFD